MYHQNQCPDNQHLQDEIDRLRADERQRDDENERRRQERRREQKERWESENRQASDWPEALEKQAFLFRRESGDIPGFPDNFFGPGADACERALEIWSEIEATKREQIQALEAQIKAIQENIRQEVAARLESEGEGRPRGWRDVARGIRDTDDFNCWLDW